MGGVFKSADNMIEEKNVDGKISVRFQPVAAWETSESVDKLL